MLLEWGADMKGSRLCVSVAHLALSMILLLAVGCALDEPAEIVIPVATATSAAESTPTLATASMPDPTPTPHPLGVYATVASVTDGDTIRGTLDGSDLPIRLILIDTPEVFGQVDCYGREASAFMAELLPPGTPVFLEKDVSEVDAFDRLLRYVYLQDGRMVNELVVSEGYALVATYPPDVKHLARIRAAEESARSLGRGLWEQCALIADPTVETAWAESTQTNAAPEPVTIATEDPTVVPTSVATPDPTPAPAVTQRPTLMPVPQPTVSEWDAYAAAECAKYQEAYIESQQAGAAPIFLAFIRSKIDEWC